MKHKISVTGSFEPPDFEPDWRRCIRMHVHIANALSLEYHNAAEL